MSLVSLFDLERVQKRALACIFPGISYEKAFSCAGLVSVRDHQDAITKKLFDSILRTKKKFPSLLLNVCGQPCNFKRRRKFAYTFARTKRFADSFIIKSSTRNSCLHHATPLWKTTQTCNASECNAVHPEQGYQLFHIHEIWYFPHWCTRLFQQYVDTWLKLKEQDSR